MTSSFIFSDSSDEESSSGSEKVDNVHGRRKVRWKKHDHQGQEIDQHIQKILHSLQDDAKTSGENAASDRAEIFQSSLISLSEVEETSFSTIIGCVAAKRDLRMDLINHAMDKDWKHCSPSYCLYGPPGTGKTSLFRALMFKLGKKFTYAYLTASTLQNKFHGESEKRLQASFEDARKNTPCIDFIDEVDSIMKTRDQKSGGSGLTGLKTTLLENLCGIRGGNKGVILVSATNFPWHLEPAFVRRSQMIYVGLPDSVEERVSIMQLYLEADHNLSKSDWKKLGKVTQGMSSSDLEKVEL